MRNDRFMFKTLDKLSINEESTQHTLLTSMENPKVEPIVNTTCYKNTCVGLFAQAQISVYLNFVHVLEE